MQRIFAKIHTSSQSTQSFSIDFWFLDCCPYFVGVEDDCSRNFLFVEANKKPVPFVDKEQATC